MPAKNSGDFVGVWFPEDLRAEIDKVAEKKFSNRSQVIKEGVAAWLEINKK